MPDKIATVLVVKTALKTGVNYMRHSKIRCGDTKCIDCRRLCPPERVDFAEARANSPSPDFDARIASLCEMHEMSIQNVHLYYVTCLVCDADFIVIEPVHGCITECPQCSSWQEIRYIPDIHLELCVVMRNLAIKDK